MQLITQAIVKVIAPAIASAIYIYQFCGCDYSQIVCMRMHMNAGIAVQSENCSALYHSQLPVVTQSCLELI